MVPKDDSGFNLVNKTRIHVGGSGKRQTPQYED